MTPTDFDFRRPPAGVLEKRIQAWLSEACALAPGKWANLLPFALEVEVIKCDSVTAGTALQRLPESTIAFRITIDRHPEDEIYLIMGRPVLLALIGGMFGELFKALPQDRDLTPVEDSVSNFVAYQLFLSLIEDAWPVADPMQLSVAAVGSPKIVCNLPTNDLRAFATLNLKGEFGTQPIFIILPRKGIMERLIAPSTDQSPPIQVDRKHIEALVQEMSVDLSVILGSVQVTLTQLAELQAGDVVVLSQKVSEPLRAKISGADKFQVWPGVVGRRRAVQVDSTITK